MAQNLSLDLNKPCAVFWDIQNNPVPKGQSPDSIVKLVRSTLISPNKLKEIYFYCVCDANCLPNSVGHTLVSLDVDIVQVYKRSKNIVAEKVCNLMGKFLEHAGSECALIILSGDGVYADVLTELKTNYKFSTYCISFLNSFAPSLTFLSDYTFALSDGHLLPPKSIGKSTSFILFSNFPDKINIQRVMNELNILGKAYGSLADSAVIFESKIAIGFSTFLSAANAVTGLNGYHYGDRELKVDLLNECALYEILRCMSSKKTIVTKKKNAVRTLTFIKISNSNDYDSCMKLVEFCIACTVPDVEYCLLFGESSIWIVFDCVKYADNFLEKFKILHQNAAISDPPPDLTSASSNNAYTVKCSTPTNVEDWSANRSSRAVVRHNNTKNNSRSQTSRKGKHISNHNNIKGASSRQVIMHNKKLDVILSTAPLMNKSELPNKRFKSDTNSTNTYPVESNIRVSKSCVNPNSTKTEFEISTTPQQLETIKQVNEKSGHNSKKDLKKETMETTSPNEKSPSKPADKPIYEPGIKVKIETID